MSQVFIGILYAILEVVAVSLLFLYKLDFSPLPLFIITSGILGYGAVRMGSAMLITISSATASLCAAFSIRDIYQFAYHSINHGRTPDNPTSMRMSTPNLATHFVIALVALVEVILACVMQALFLKALIRTVAGIFNKMEFPKALKWLHLITIGQIILSAGIILFGFVIFLTRTEFLVVFGDYSISMGLLLLASGILSLFVVRRPVLLLPSIATQLVTLTLIWQQSDEFAYLIMNYLDIPPDLSSAPGDPTQGGSKEGPSGGISSLSFLNFGLFMTYFFLCGASILLQGAVLEGTRFMKLDANPSKFQELVSMGMKQGTVTTELNEFVDEEKNAIGDEEKNGVLVDA